MPKFSIIIPVYNVAPYLRECLDSVLAQTFIDWEATCVDDGSTDGSGAILDEYAAKDARFHVIHQKNAGVSAARNAALDVAKGEWIAYLDADDVWHHEFLSEIADVIGRYSDCKLFRHGVVRYRDGMPCGFGQSTARFDEIDISHGMSLADFCGHYFCQHVYRRDLIGPVRFPCYLRGEDRVFFGSIVLTRCDKIAVSEAPRYGYRQRLGSAMNSVPSVQMLKDEMCHRRDLVLMIEASGKKVEYASGYWLEWYFTKEVGQSIMRKAPRERAELWGTWIGCVDEMRQAKGISRSTRMIYNLCSRFRSRLFWWFLCRAWPWYNSHGILPRGIRKTLRVIK